MKCCTNREFAVKMAAFVLYVVGAIRAASNQAAIAASVDQYVFLAPVMRVILAHSFATYLILGGGCLAAFIFYPVDRLITSHRFERIGLVNKAGVVPKLLRKYPDRSRTNITVWIFDNQSIPIDVWEAKRSAIEAALNVTICKLQYGKSKCRVLLYTVPATGDLPAKVTWKDAFLPAKDFELSLGVGFSGPVMVNLAQVPHILLGGSTGSGKSVLLKCLLMQAIQKGAAVCVADFKGGVDFSGFWHEQCQMCFSEETLIELLNMLVDTLEARKQLFRAAEVPNIAEYNKATGENLLRYVFACDEVAEVLDKTGLNNDQKEVVNQIESRLATIARQGRAFGIHLILATQRPDANILSGQIKNNLDCRICGRADNVLSQIILDNTGAADQIPKDVSGRFLLHDGTVFQGYWFEEL